MVAKPRESLAERPPPALWSSSSRALAGVGRGQLCPAHMTAPLSGSPSCLSLPMTAAQPGGVHHPALAVTLPPHSILCLLLSPKKPWVYLVPYQ